MFEEDDADLAARKGAPVEILGDRDQRGDRRRVAAQCDRVGAVDRHHRDAVRRELGQRRRDLARAGIVEPDHPGRAIVHRDVDLGEDLADAPDIVGEIGDDDRAAAGGDRAVAADQTAASVSTAAAGSIRRTRKISVTKRLDEARREPPTGAEAAAPATGWTRSALPEAGTATKPLARSVLRNSSKYSERESGRSVTTETRPCTLGSMIMLRPVTRAASWMKARISASRRFSTYCACAGVAAKASGARQSAEAIRRDLSFKGASCATGRRGRRDPR